MYSRGVTLEVPPHSLGGTPGSIPRGSNPGVPRKQPYQIWTRLGVLQALGLGVGKFSACFSVNLNVQGQGCVTASISASIRFQHHFQHLRVDVGLATTRWSVRLQRLRSQIGSGWLSLGRGSSLLQAFLGLLSPLGPSWLLQMPSCKGSWGPWVSHGDSHWGDSRRAYSMRCTSQGGLPGGSPWTYTQGWG